MQNLSLLHSLSLTPIESSSSLANFPFTYAMHDKMENAALAPLSEETWAAMKDEAGQIAHEYIVRKIAFQKVSVTCASGPAYKYIYMHSRCILL